jgi:hypothetical protein
MAHRTLIGAVGVWLVVAAIAGCVPEGAPTRSAPAQPSASESLLPVPSLRLGSPDPPATVRPIATP